MASGCDEIKEGVYTIVAESWVSLDSRFLCKDVVVLSLKVAHDFAKCRLVVDLVSKTWSIDDCQRDSRALFVKLEFCASVRVFVSSQGSYRSYQLSLA